MWREMAPAGREMALVWREMALAGREMALAYAVGPRAPAYARHAWRSVDSRWAAVAPVLSDSTIQ